MGHDVDFDGSRPTASTLDEQKCSPVKSMETDSTHDNRVYTCSSSSSTSDCNDEDRVNLSGGGGGGDDGGDDDHAKEFDWSTRDTPTPELTPLLPSGDPYSRYRNEPVKQPHLRRTPRPPPATLEPRLLVYRRRVPRVRVSSRYLKQRKRLNAVRLDCNNDGE